MCDAIPERPSLFEITPSGTIARDDIQQQIRLGRDDEQQLHSDGNCNDTQHPIGEGRQAVGVALILVDLLAELGKVLVQEGPHVIDALAHVLDAHFDIDGAASHVSGSIGGNVVVHGARWIDLVDLEALELEVYRRARAIGLRVVRKDLLERLREIDRSGNVAHTAFKHRVRVDLGAQLDDGRKSIDALVALLDVTRVAHAIVGALEIDALGVLGTQRNVLEQNRVVLAVKVAQRAAGHNDRSLDECNLDLLVGVLLEQRVLDGELAARQRERVELRWISHANRNLIRVVGGLLHRVARLGERVEQLEVQRVGAVQFQRWLRVVLALVAVADEALFARAVVAANGVDAVGCMARRTVVSVGGALVDIDAVVALAFEALVTIALVRADGVAARGMLRALCGTEFALINIFTMTTIASKASSTLARVAALIIGDTEGKFMAIILFEFRAQIL
jgi:hypothetical protein